jgi:hypothetical protein
LERVTLRAAGPQLVRSKKTRDMNTSPDIGSFEFERHRDLAGAPGSRVSTPPWTWVHSAAISDRLITGSDEQLRPNRALSAACQAAPTPRAAVLALRRTPPRSEMAQSPFSWWPTDATSPWRRPWSVQPGRVVTPVIRSERPREGAHERSGQRVCRLLRPCWSLMTRLAACRVLLGAPDRDDHGAIVSPSRS